MLSSVGGGDGADPAVVDADLGVDAGPVLLGAAFPPGHHALQLAVAHHGAAGVHLAGHRGRRLLRGLLRSGEDKLTLPPDVEPILNRILATLMCVSQRSFLYPPTSENPLFDKFSHD